MGCILRFKYKGCRRKVFSFWVYERLPVFKELTSKNKHNITAEDASIDSEDMIEDKRKIALEFLWEPIKSGDTETMRFKHSLRFLNDIKYSLDYRSGIKWVSYQYSSF